MHHRQREIEEYSMHESTHAIAHAARMHYICSQNTYLMPKYPIPESSKREVNRAGEIFLDPAASAVHKDTALAIINNWRTSHNFPLNTFQMRLRKVAKAINSESLVAQRIKRLASIRLKLERFPEMKMAQIQDIGGCIAIMKHVTEVDQLVNIYKHDSRGIKHKLAREQDYILFPKPSGYRGIHLIYKYRSDKVQAYDDMRIEIQIRTLMQHAWATTVETVGTFIQQSLKSSQGEDDWLRFFIVMSSAMAILEGKAIVPGTSENFEELREEIRHLANKLDVEGHLTTFRQSIEVIGEKRISNAHYYLLELDPYGRKVTIKPYSHTQLDIASSDYLTLEKRIYNENRDAVLVSADSIESLKLAFPNYYLDTEYFLTLLKGIVDEQSAPSNQLSLF